MCSADPSSVPLTYQCTENLQWSTYLVHWTDLERFVDRSVHSPVNFGLFCLSRCPIVQRGTCVRAGSCSGNTWRWGSGGSLRLLPEPRAPRCLRYQRGARHAGGVSNVAPPTINENPVDAHALEGLRVTRESVGRIDRFCTVMICFIQMCDRKPPSPTFTLTPLPSPSSSLGTMEVEMELFCKDLSQISSPQRHWDLLVHVSCRAFEWRCRPARKVGMQWVRRSSHNVTGIGVWSGLRQRMFSFCRRVARFLYSGPLYFHNCQWRKYSTTECYRN